jgi:hypothetical protein
MGDLELLLGTRSTSQQNAESRPTTKANVEV